MLKHLSVRNLAVVEDLALDFDSGMTSLTGETGAGKSLLVDALGLVLGDRGDAGLIRHGQERAEIEATFATDNNLALYQWLCDNELEEETLCHLRRTINRKGPSKAYINGRQVPISQLREISERTIDIHGQHAHQSLLRTETHRQLLDIVADHQNLLKEMRQAFRDWQQTCVQLEAVRQHSDESQARYELLQYQVQELEVLELSDDYVNQLVQEQHQLAHAAQLMEASQSALETLFDQEHSPAYSQLSHTITDLTGLQEYEPRFETIVETLNAALINMDESESALRHYLDHAELDPARLSTVEETLSMLHELARKHQVEIEQLPAHYQALSEELVSLSDSQQDATELARTAEKQQQQCEKLASQIHQQRAETATRLSKELTESIRELAMPAGEITIDVRQTERLHEHGFDQVNIRVTTNPGQPAGDLGKVASGGELARISLAIQVVTAGRRTVPTLVFDEVDVGIGGGIAEIVGQHLRLLASTQQVICITHLPQVAAQAHHQLQVTKQHDADSARIEIQTLSASQRVEEIARMLGGVRLTEKTRSHAQEMLEQAQT